MQAPIPSTNCVIAEHLSLKVKNLIETRGIDIVRPWWVMECARTGSIVSLEPKYMLHTSTGTERKFRVFIDRYGDHFAEASSRATLEEVRVHLLVYLDAPSHIFSSLPFHYQ